MKLSADQIAQFEEEGYLLLRGALADADLDPVIAEYEEHIAHRAEDLLAAGKISELYADEPFTIENEEMTPSMKIRRHKIKERYGERLDGLYRA